jgi:hypothetical protein
LKYVKRRKGKNNSILGSPTKKKMRIQERKKEENQNKKKNGEK